jgi:hypothetical protein
VTNKRKRNSGGCAVEKAKAVAEARADFVRLCEAEKAYRQGDKSALTPEELMALAVRQAQRVEFFADLGEEPRELLHQALFAVEEIRELIMEQRAKRVQ